MKNELPQPVIIAIVIGVVLLAIGAGWMYLNHDSTPIVKVAGERGTSAGGGGGGAPPMRPGGNRTMGGSRQ